MTRRKMASPASGTPRVKAATPEAAEVRETPERTIRRDETREKVAAAPREVGEAVEEPQEKPVMTTEEQKSKEQKPPAPAKAGAKPKPEAEAAKLAATAPALEDIGAFNREAAETMMQTAASMAKCCEALGVEWIDYARTSVDHGVATSRDLMSCRTVEDAVNIQGRFFKEALDAYFAESARMSEISLKMANETLTPINDRVRKVVGTMQRPFAA